MVVLPGVVGVIGSWRVRQTDLQDGWYQGVTE